MIFFCLFRHINNSTNYYESNLVRAEQIILNKILNNQNQNQLLVGSGKSNITPLKKTKLVGYGLRDEFEGVHDSLFVRSLCLKSENVSIVILSFDLLLVTPNLKKEILLKSEELGIDNLYFSATHTHSSFGGYGEGILSRFTLAKYDEEVVERIVNQAINSIKKSIAVMDTVSSISYQKIKSNHSINRITDEREIADKLRSINFIDKSGKISKIYSANSHSTIVGRVNTLLSNDYPALLMKNDSSYFNMFLAGTMGSLSPVVPTDISAFEKVNYFVDVLNNGNNTIDSIKIGGLNFETYRFNNFKQTIKINRALEIRPWVYDWIVGKSKNEIETLKIGDLLMIALPCELSYEYYDKLEELAKRKGLKLMITTFNGSYLGYCTPSKHYNIDNMETREMNWMGKYGGDYFNEVIKMIIEKQ